VVSTGSASAAVLDPASPDAAAIAALSRGLFWAAALVLFVTLGLLALAVVMGRLPGGRPLSSRWQWVLVAGGGFAAPFLAALGLTVWSVSIGDEEAGPQGVRGPTVEVVGERWWWRVRYLGEDGEVIAETANEIHVPVGLRTRVLLKTDNVIHSFWAPAVQGKTDMIPGRTNVLYAQPERAGVYRGQCAEFCGVQHSLMGFRLVAMEEEAFEEWLARQARPAVAEHEGFAVFEGAGCAECHAIRGTTADGEVGPDLTHIASRETLAAGTIPNTRGNLGGWITDPQRVKPGALMPPSPMPAEDLHALLAFLETLE
jgi:cytochrome c oxidase subunit 2